MNDERQTTTLCLQEINFKFSLPLSLSLSLSLSKPTACVSCNQSGNCAQKDNDKKRTNASHHEGDDCVSQGEDVSQRNWVRLQ
jgi:hypothetical protein